jgi:hypothetical protein
MTQLKPYLYLSNLFYTVIFVQISAKSDGDPFKRQRYLSVHSQQEGLCIKNNRRWSVFARRHLEAGQYMAQSRLDLHQPEPHPYEQNQ